MDKTSQFISSVRMRLNLQTLTSESASALLICSVAATTIALGFVIAGHKAVMLAILAAPAFAAVCLIFRMALLSHSAKSAAKAADSIFALKDALASSIELPKREDGGHPFHSLREKATALSCEKLDLSSIKIQTPWGRIAFSAALLCLCAWLCAIPESPALAAKRDAIQECKERSALFKERIQEELKELEKQLPEDEAEALRSSRLAKLVEELKGVQDPREALRQYASIEMELKKMLNKDSIRDDERLLSDLARRLKEDPQTKELGEKLSSQNYQEAAKELERQAAEKAPDPNSKDGLDSSEKRLESMRRMAERMEREAAKREGMKSSIRDSMLKLSNATKEQQKELQKASKEAANSGSVSKDSSERISGNWKEIDAKLEKLSKNLKDHDARKAFLSKSESLASALLKAQMGIASSKEGRQAADGAQGASNSPVNGKGIGTAASGRFDNPGSESSREGYEDSVHGAKSDGGESLKKIEEAASGSGSSSGARSARNSEFKRQYENFIRKEDVPEGMKGAVKLYFNSLHED